MARISKKKFKAAIPGSGGVQAAVAQKIGVTRQSVSRYLKKNPKLKEFLDQEAERIIDISENILDSSIIKDRDIDSAKWKLINSKRGKARGYGPKQELDVSDESTRIIIERANNEDKNNTLETKRETGTGSESP